jgi:hypothetical protein
MTLPHPWSPGLAGLPVLAGSAALALAALLALGLAPRWQADADAAGRDLRRQRAAAAAAPARPVAAAAPAPTAASTLLPALPGADTLPQRQAALAALALHHGITLDGLRLAAPQGLGSGAGALPAQRVALRLAGTAPYAAWRRFVAEALQQDDALLLEQLQLGRASTSAALLTAELQWSLLQRSGGAAATSQAPQAGQARRATP